MHITCEDLDVEVLESTSGNEDQFGGRWGWFWHECHMPPRGPFGTPAEAVGDFAAWVSEHYDHAPSDATTDGPQSLARTFLANAAGFLVSAEAAVGANIQGEISIASCCYALELILKAYLLSRGRSDGWNEEHVRHDLTKAWREAVFLGLPGDDARIERFLKVASGAYARHELMELSRQRPTLLDEIDVVTAIRALHRDVESRMPGGVRILHRKVRRLARARPRYARGR